MDERLNLDLDDEAGEFIDESELEGEAEVNIASQVPETLRNEENIPVADDTVVQAPSEHEPAFPGSTSASNATPMVIDEPYTAPPVPLATTIASTAVAAATTTTTTGSFPSTAAPSDYSHGHQIPVKRGRGRPRIRPLPTSPIEKRKRGRPRKHPLPDPNEPPKPKRPRGRPRKGQSPAHIAIQESPESQEADSGAETTAPGWKKLNYYPIYATDHPTQVSALREPPHHAHRDTYVADIRRSPSSTPETSKARSIDQDIEMQDPKVFNNESDKQLSAGHNADQRVEDDTVPGVQLVMSAGYTHPVPDFLRQPGRPRLTDLENKQNSEAATSALTSVLQPSDDQTFAGPQLTSGYQSGSGELASSKQPDIELPNVKAPPWDETNAIIVLPPDLKWELTDDEAWPSPKILISRSDSEVEDEDTEGDDPYSQISELDEEGYSDIEESEDDDEDDRLLLEQDRADDRTYEEQLWEQFGMVYAKPIILEDAEDSDVEEDHGLHRDGVHGRELENAPKSNSMIGSDEDEDIAEYVPVVGSGEHDVSGSE